MTAFAKKMSLTITDMIRMDHTHVLSTFHKYRVDTSPKTKQALVNTVCIALEIHAQLEEEIFYPAMRAVAGDSKTLSSSVPEHDAMRELIGRLRTMRPSDSDYDDTFMKLIREVMHHVAEEETVLLPQAELLLANRLRELGTEMTKRRLQLAAPRAGEIGYNMARGRPVGTGLIAAGALLAGTYFLQRSAARRHA